MMRLLPMRSFEILSGLILQSWLLKVLLGEPWLDYENFILILIILVIIRIRTRKHAMPAYSYMFLIKLILMEFKRHINTTKNWVFELAFILRSWLRAFLVWLIFIIYYSVSIINYSLLVCHMPKKYV